MDGPLSYTMRHDSVLDDIRWADAPVMDADGGVVGPAKFDIMIGNHTHLHRPHGQIGTLAAPGVEQAAASISNLCLSGDGGI